LNSPLGAGRSLLPIDAGKNARSLPAESKARTLRAGLSISTTLARPFFSAARRGGLSADAAPVVSAASGR
jgi:hypothetical protein